VRIIAIDWNENTGEETITLEEPGTPIPSFSVVPDNHYVKLSWNGVPGAEEYTIYYATNGTFPTRTYGHEIENITDSYSPNNPFVIDELENGYLNVFMLEAKTGDGNKSWLSNYEMAIPISRLRLVPILRGDYREIEIYWPDIPATDEYEFLRA